jgi:hypothetical protein
MHSGFFLDPFSTLNMEVIRSPETPVHMRTSRSYIPEAGSQFHILLCWLACSAVDSRPTQSGQQACAFSKPRAHCSSGSLAGKVVLLSFCDQVFVVCKVYRCVENCVTAIPYVFLT